MCLKLRGERGGGERSCTSELLFSKARDVDSMEKPPYEGCCLLALWLLQVVASSQVGLSHTIYRRPNAWSLEHV